MSTEEHAGLTIGEVLEAVYQMLKDKKDDFSGKVISLPEEAWTEVANDNDWHRSRSGVLIYNEVVWLNINGSRWTIARSIDKQGYPADPYDSDLIAIPCQKEEVEIEKIRNNISKSCHFKNSLLMGLYDGLLVLSNHRDNRFTQKLLPPLQSDLAGFIFKEKEIDHEHFFLDLRPVIKRPMLYKPEIVDYLSDLILKTLASFS